MPRPRDAFTTVSTDRSSWVRSVSGPWILALAGSKAGDLATTFAGLTVVDGLTERNPVAGAVFDQFGVVGLVVLSAAVLVIVVAVVERAATVLDRHDETAMSAVTVYRIGYCPLVALFSLTTVYNVVILCIHTQS